MGRCVGVCMCVCVCGLVVGWVGWWVCGCKILHKYISYINVYIYILYTYIIYITHMYHIFYTHTSYILHTYIIYTCLYTHHEISDKKNPKPHTLAYTLHPKPEIITHQHLQHTIHTQTDRHTHTHTHTHTHFLCTHGR